MGLLSAVLALAFTVEAERHCVFRPSLLAALLFQAVSADGQLAPLLGGQDVGSRRRTRL